MTDARRREAELVRELASLRKARKAPARAARAVSENDPATKLNGEPGEATLRKAIPYAWKARIWASQDFRCAKCRSRLPTPSEAEYDHVLPLALKGEHAERNIQALCPRPCHIDKTGADVRRIAKAKRQAKLLKPREPSKRPLKSRGFR